MPGSLTLGGGENVPAFPAHAQPAILRIWQEAHGSASWRDGLSVVLLCMSAWAYFSNCCAEWYPMGWQVRCAATAWRQCPTYGKDVVSYCYLRFSKLCRPPWLTNSPVLWKLCSVAYIVLSGHFKGSCVCFWPYTINTYTLS